MNRYMGDSLEGVLFKRIDMTRICMMLETFPDETTLKVLNFKKYLMLVHKSSNYSGPSPSL